MDQVIDYNEEPVHYCTECLSLRIRPYEDGVDYCDECGSTEVSQSHITDWEKKYEERYKESYLRVKKIK